VSDIQLSLEAVESLACAALKAAGAAEQPARSLAHAIMAAERDGIASHGLAYLPTYCEHLRCGKVSRDAIPESSVHGSVVKVDAASGFAHPAITLGFSHLVPLTRALGAAVLAVRNSYNCGVLGYHTERLAREGLVGLGFTNAPASIAPVGGRRPLIGTNPWSVAAPDGQGGVAFLIDQSASVATKSEVMKRARLGESIPLGWANDSAGQPTTDPQAALKGTMAPAGGYKGFGSGMLVELFAACLTGALLGINASPFSGPSGGPPKTGQFFVAIDPGATSSNGFAANIASLLDAIRQEPGAHVPGDHRKASAEKTAISGIWVSATLYRTIKELTEVGSGPSS